MAEKNFKSLIEKFISGSMDGMVGNLKIQNNYLIHFDTVILERSNEKFIINFTRYSIQTARLQNQIKSLIPQNQIYKIVVKVPVNHRLSIKDFPQASDQL